MKKGKLAFQGATPQLSPGGGSRSLGELSTILWHTEEIYLPSYCSFLLLLCFVFLACINSFALSRW